MAARPHYFFSLFMKSSFFLACAIVLSCTVSDAPAQSTEAARYVNPQGIEVIQARRPPAPEAERADKASAPKKTGSTAPPASIDGKLQVSAKEQSTRDEDRLAILSQELARESASLENKVKILQTPAMKAKLSEDELKRLQETLLDHEKNMRALNAEISRVRLRR